MSEIFTGQLDNSLKPGRVLASLGKHLQYSIYVTILFRMDGITLTGSLRELVNASDLSRYEIALRSRLDPPQLYRFLERKKGLSLEALDRLCAVLGATAVQTQPQQDLRTDRESRRTDRQKNRLRTLQLHATGMGGAAIARMLDLPTGTVYAWVSRAKKAGEIE